MRKYDRGLGRFTLPDPLWEKYVNLTPYQYAGNNPVSYFDASGYELRVVGNIKLGKQDLDLFIGDEFSSLLNIDENGIVSINTNNYLFGSSKEVDFLNTLINSEKKFGYEAFEGKSQMFPHRRYSSFINKANKAYDPIYEIGEFGIGPGMEPPAGLDGYVGLSIKSLFYNNETDANKHNNEQRRIIIGHELLENYHRVVNEQYQNEAHKNSNMHYWGGSTEKPIIIKEIK